MYVHWETSFRQIAVTSARSIFAFGFNDLAILILVETVII